MKFSSAHITKIAAAIFIAILITTCSDAFLKSDREPSNLDVQPDNFVSITGKSFEFDLRLTDQKGVPFKNIPAWTDTAITGAEGILEIIGGRIQALKPALTEVEFELAGLSEDKSVRVTPRFYMTQSVQNPARSVPMVAGRDGVLRLFLQGEERNFNSISVEIYQNGAPIETLNYSFQQVSRVSINENILAVSLPVSGSLIQPGLSIKILKDGITYPTSGTAETIAVETVPKFNLSFVPIYIPLEGRAGNVAGRTEVYMEPLLDMFPVNEVDVKVHSMVTISADPAQDTFTGTVVNALHSIWLVDGSPDYTYYGVYPTRNGSTGRAYAIGCRVAVGVEIDPIDINTFVHEIGHCMGRRHVRCNGNEAGPDPNYPYPGGGVGVYGYEVDANRPKAPGAYKDLMSYCRPEWISDYTYNAILDYRERNNANQNLNKQPEEVLLVWGMIKKDELILRPAFKITAPPSLPEKPGPYTLFGYDEQGRQLFSINFAGSRVIDSPHNIRVFSFTVPVRHVEIEKLESLRLTGRNLNVMRQTIAAAKPPLQPKALGNITAQRKDVKSVSVDWGNVRYEMALVKNPETGEVLGFTKGGASTIRTEANRIKMFFSDGVQTVVKNVVVQ